MKETIITSVKHTAKQSVMNDFTYKSQLIAEMFNQSPACPCP